MVFEDARQDNMLLNLFVVRKNLLNHQSAGYQRAVLGTTLIK